jgi:hypothetical protein
VLTFSVRGLLASQLVAAAMAFVLDDMHDAGAALDSPKGGSGIVIDAVVHAAITQQGNNKSRLYLHWRVECIDFSKDTTKVTSITLQNRK